MMINLSPIKAGIVLFWLCLWGPQGCNEAPHENKPTHSTNEETIALPLRLALMSGHVEAGLALYRANEPAMAAPHLLHPVSETHAAEREGLEAFGFDGDLFETVSHALDKGLEAAEIEAQLLTAESNLALVAEKVGGDKEEIISFLMDNVVAEYEIAITEGVVADVGEYQDAYGFSIIARKHANTLKGTTGTQTRAALDDLIGQWPAAPIPPEQPTNLQTIKRQVSKVFEALHS